jgi:hypothetical protein
MSPRTLLALSLPFAAFAALVAAQAQAAPTVPWVNQAATPRAAVQAASAAAAARACAATDLRITAGAAGAYRGHATQEIRLANAGSDTCHLPGFPGVQLQPDSGAPQSVGASDLAPELANARLELAPGEEVVLLLGTPGSCDAAAGPERRVNKRLQLALPGGGVKALEGVHVDTLCGRATVVKFERVHGEAMANARALAVAPALSQLTGSISAPDEAVRGGVLRYTVTLTNSGAAPVSLANCPAYTQSVYAEGRAQENTLRLNCGGAGAQIPANASVSFEMQTAVPADLAAGSGKLAWRLQDGPAVGKLISVR